jgi:hypothetical protein
MAFNDVPIAQGLLGKTITGLDVTKTSTMTLEVASGNVLIHKTGVTHTFPDTESHTFVADTNHKRDVHMSVVSNGSNVLLWIDDFIDNGNNIGARMPDGYEVVCDLAWFVMNKSETDLDNVTVNRRLYI